MAGLYVETLVRADLDELWRLTQTPREHARWDLRFASIEPTGVNADGAQTFRYARRIAGRTVAGRGVSVGERRRPDGTRTSALRFRSDDPRSPLRHGAGYWRYVPTDDGVRFLTGYTYEPGWGRLGAAVDPWLLRPFVGWLTARSFDALRIWLEHDSPPEQTHRRGHVDLALRAAAVVAVICVGASRGTHVGLLAGAVAAVVASRVPAADDVPLARRCLRRPPGGRVAAPQTLAGLAEPA